VAALTAMAPLAALGLPRSFTTAGIPADQQVELWQAHNSEALMGLHCRAIVDAEFGGETVNVQLAQAHLSRVKAHTAHVIERRSDLIKRGPGDSIVLFLVLAGEASFHHSEGIRTLRAGQLVACDSDQPFVRGFSREFEELFVKVPRPVFFERTGLERLGAPLFAAFGHDQNPFARSLAGLVGRSTRVDGTWCLPDEDALLELVGALLGGRECAGTTAYLAAARRHVDDRLSDPSLSAASIAAAVGISPRHLSRAFASVGITVPQYVLGRRLEAARAMLHRPDAAAMTIAEVAERCGFGSVTHFSRSFALRFGDRASDVRRYGRQQRGLAWPEETSTPHGARAVSSY
jgi:AraC-like DNA-binding protein